MLTEGQKAPAFSGKDQNGNKVSLADFKGKKLVIFFYPEDDTPTCTEQACNLRDNYSLLKKNGFEVVGISPDDVQKHARYQEKFDLPFTLVADPDHKIIDKYEVWGEKNMYGRKYMGLFRTTYIVDEKGQIIKVFKKPRVRQHAEEIIEKTKALS
jgi:thioredoxin-dependent peroxiredoxin